MVTLLNIWHYLALVIILLIFAGGVAFAIYNKQNRGSIIITFALISLFLLFFSFSTIDSLTKSAVILNLKHQRLLNSEEIMFSGVVQNNGEYEIGSVELELQMTNSTNVGNSWKDGGSASFSSKDFFGSVRSKDPSEIAKAKPQRLNSKFIIATNLKPRESKRFSVTMPYPPYFDGMTPFTTLKLH